MGYIFKYKLTERQLDTLSLLAQGFTNKEMAKLLGCKEQTVKNSLKQYIYPKLGLAGANCNIQATVIFIKELKDDTDSEWDSGQKSLRSTILPHPEQAASGSPITTK